MNKIQPSVSDTEMIERNQINSEEGKRKRNSDITYGIDDVPPWYLSLLLGFQVIVTFCVHIC